MVKDGKSWKTKDVIITAPLGLEGESNADYKAPNFLQRLFSLLNNVRPGSDLTRFQVESNRRDLKIDSVRLHLESKETDLEHLPPMFNLPKSHLQCYGESVYCVNKDLLSKCNNGDTPIERMISVVAWSISTLRPLMFGVVPYNPILGETHHASKGTLNVLLEQVSHHPPVSALHATDETNNIELLWCHYAVPKFYGATIETVVHGTRKLKLLKRGETYMMNSPKLLIRLLPKPGVDWEGNVNIKCKETGLEAELSFKGSSFFGFGGSNKLIRGKIIDSASFKTLYDINGNWDRTVQIKDIIDGKTKVLYNAKEAISALPSPTLKDPDGVWPSESAAVWAEVSKAILSKDWDKAREAKRAVEESERELLRQRKSMAEDWVPKHFDLLYSPDNGWDCIPKQSTVPPAPIVSPM